MMKKLLYFFLLLPLMTVAQTTVYSYGFSGTTADLTTAGWSQVNRSTPVGASTFLIPTTANTAFTSGGYSGGATSFILVNYNSTTGTGDISNWLFTPVINVQNGDIVKFYSRKGGTGTGTIYPDNLQLRMSTNGAFTNDPAAGATSIGDYTNLLVEINPVDLSSGTPAYSTSLYPFTWTQYTYTISGLSGPTDCKFAFRYNVLNGGPSGANSDIIGIDDFLIERPAANTQDFFAGNFAIQPNPVSDVFTLSTKNGVAIEKVEVLDINGRIVSQVNGSATEALQVNVSDLNSGVYFVRVQSDLGVGTSKIIKK